MKIASSNVQMAASHLATQTHEISESLNFWVGQRQGQEAGANAPVAPSTTVDLSPNAQNSQSAEALNKQIDDAVNKDPKLRLIMDMLQFITGRPVRLLDVADLQAANQDGGVSGLPTNATPAPQTPASTSAGFGLAYDYHESYSETEQTTFSASGSVRTTDGKTIDFQLNLVMSRSYSEESNVSLRLGDAARAKDPLVINFAGTAAELSDQKFSFDLDSDGQKESISTLKSGSGFLAFDRNHDGQINNGSELFGAQSGDGYAELAALDDDKNGWIDENDKSFKTLSVWTPSADGQGQSLSLAEAGIGAVALARIATPYELKNGYNQALGTIRSSSIALQENGKIATTQQIDVVV